jgi:cathepsin D
MSGILGLGYGSISVDKLPTFIDQANLTDKSFAFYLNLDPVKSYLTIPGFDAAAKSDDFKYHNVVEQRYWSLNLSGLKQGDKKIDSTGFKAVIDSGTSVIVGPNTLVAPLIAGITVADDCSNVASLPSITFTIDDTDYVLESKDYVLAVTDSGQTECVLGIMGQDFPAAFDYFILGDSFIRKFYAHFDKNNNRVGFATPASQ